MAQKSRNSCSAWPGPAALHGQRPTLKLDAHAFAGLFGLSLHHPMRSSQFGRSREAAAVDPLLHVAARGAHREGLRMNFLSCFARLRILPSISRTDARPAETGTTPPHPSLPPRGHPLTASRVAWLRHPAYDQRSADPHRDCRGALMRLHEALGATSAQIKAAGLERRVSVAPRWATSDGGFAVRRFSK